jgi:hypothetical protein
MASTYDDDHLSTTEVIFAIGGGVIGGAIGFALVGFVGAVASAAIGALGGVLLTGAIW